DRDVRQVVGGGFDRAVAARLLRERAGGNRGEAVLGIEYPALAAPVFDRERHFEWLHADPAKALAEAQAAGADIGAGLLRFGIRVDRGDAPVGVGVFIVGAQPDLAWRGQRRGEAEDRLRNGRSG